ncbi:MAG: diguanylate cyclase [Rhodocyclaceae bacterium]|nr:diguanylate cyclase [Rhodocyclaceae bacterium]
MLYKYPLQKAESCRYYCTDASFVTKVTEGGYGEAVIRRSRLPFAAGRLGNFRGTRFSIHGRHRLRSAHWLSTVAAACAQPFGSPNSCRRQDKPFSVLWADLDRFKQVNESFGHLGGDAVIAMVARRLGDAVAGRAEAARMGRRRVRLSGAFL